MLLSGTIVGLIAGLVHAVYVYQRMKPVPGSTDLPNRSRGLYFAVWTLLLWLLFGSYILVLWIIGTVVFLLAKLNRTHGRSA